MKIYIILIFLHVPDLYKTIFIIYQKKVYVCVCLCIYITFVCLTIVQKWLLTNIDYILYELFYRRHFLVNHGFIRPGLFIGGKN